MIMRKLLFLVLFTLSFLARGQEVTTPTLRNVVPFVGGFKVFVADADTTPTLMATAAAGGQTYVQSRAVTDGEQWIVWITGLPENGANYAVQLTVGAGSWIVATGNQLSPVAPSGNPTLATIDFYDAYLGAERAAVIRAAFIAQGQQLPSAQRPAFYAAVQAAFKSAYQAARAAQRARRAAAIARDQIELDLEGLDQ